MTGFSAGGGNSRGVFGSSTMITGRPTGAPATEPTTADDDGRTGAASVGGALEAGGDFFEQLESETQTATTARQRAQFIGEDGSSDIRSRPRVWSATAASTNQRFRMACDRHGP